MANPTTNFGWVMPTSTSLVTNLPADFNTFGQGVDTSLQYLLGGTTGQVLSKTSGTNMAFTWVTPQVGDITGVTAGTGISGGGTSGDVTVTNSMATAMTTKGDLVPATGSGTFSRLAIGTNNQILTADSTAATGMKWATAASASPTSATATVATSQSTSSTSFTDLTTSGPAVTITTGTKAIALITGRFTSPAAGNARMGVTISGATTLAATDALATSEMVSADNRWSLAIPYTGLTAGSNTFTCKYKTGGGSGTSTFEQRDITVIDLGS